MTGGACSRDVVSVSFNPKTESFEARKMPSSLMIERGNHSMVTYNDNFVVIGGSNVNKVLNSCESWNKSGFWEPFPSMIKARRNLSAVTLDDSIYTFGGRNQRKIILNTIERYR